MASSNLISRELLHMSPLSALIFHNQHHPRRTSLVLLFWSLDPMRRGFLCSSISRSDQLGEREGAGEAP